MKKTSNTSERNRRKNSSRGETIVEVLFATVILSTVIAGAYTLTNRATRIGQSSIERTEAVNHVESATETLRGIAFSRGGAWSEIMNNHVSTTPPDYSDDTTCEPTNSPAVSPFYLDESGDPDDASTVNGGTTTMGVAGSKQWIEAYDDASSNEYVDFHVRACWLSISGNEVNRTGTVLRLYTGWSE